MAKTIQYRVHVEHDFVLTVSTDMGNTEEFAEQVGYETVRDEAALSAGGLISGAATLVDVSLIHEIVEGGKAT